MEFKEIIARRYATKQFQPRQVPEDTVKELLEMVRWAPSGLNIQPWRIKVVADAATKALLEPATPDEPQIRSCSHLLVFCVDTDFAALSERLGQAMKDHGLPEWVQQIVMGIAAEMSGLPEQEKQTWLRCQVYIAATYALLAATSLGLDSCPMTHFLPAEYSRILGLPAHIQPVLLVALGYGADEPHPKWRYPVEDLLL